VDGSFDQIADLRNGQVTSLSRIGEGMRHTSSFSVISSTRQLTVVQLDAGWALDLRRGGGGVDDVIHLPSSTTSCSR
jgi:hypothetical protein